MSGLKKNAEQAWESNLETLHCKLYSMIEICQEGKILVYLPPPTSCTHAPPRVCVFRQKALRLRLKAQRTGPTRRPALPQCLAQLGIGIEVDAAGISIPASCISVRYWSIPVPDWVPFLFRYRTGSGIRIFVHSYTGLTGCGQSNILAFKKGYTLHVHTASCENGYTLYVGGKEYAPCTPQTAADGVFLQYDIEKTYGGMPEKNQSGIGISSGSQLPQSGIGIPASGFRPVPLVTDQSGIAQPWCLQLEEGRGKGNNLCCAGRADHLPYQELLSASFWQAQLLLLLLLLVYY